MTINLYSPAAEPLSPLVAGSSLKGPILVATDGTDASDAALIAGEMVSRHTGASLTAVSAVQPAASPLVAPDLLMPLAQIQEVEVSSRRARIELQIASLAKDAEWPVDIAIGNPAPVIAAVAREQQASLIVTGLGQHNILVRMFGTETPLAIARIADVPVLCVPPNFDRLPRLIVVAMDFGAECIRAAVAVRPLLAEATHVYIVHVKPKDRLDMPANVLSEWERVYESELNETFERVIETLGLPPDVGVTTVVLRGSPAREILDFTTSAHAELLVAGHGHRGRFERLMGGSVASQLFRGTHCALLLAPDAQLPSAMSLRTTAPSTETFFDRSRWASELLLFSERNAGRQATMEIDDARLGAQIVARNLPITGADYDWRDDAVEIEIGGESATSPNLMHRVRGPVSISVQRSADGCDQALRIERLEGQTLLILDSMNRDW